MNGGILSAQDSRFLETLETRELYAQVIDNAKDILLIMDMSGNIIRANKEAVNEYGYSHDELQRMDVFQLRNMQNSEFVKEQFQMAKSNGIEFQTVHYRKCGTALPVEVKSVGISYDCNEYVVSIVRNIEKRIQTEENIRYLASLVEESKDVVIANDLNGRITGWNRGAELFYGYSRDEVLGMNLEMLMPEGSDYREEIGKNIEDVINSHGFQDREIVRRKKNGELGILSVNGYPIYDVNKNVIGTSILGRDYTEKQKLINQLQENEEKYRHLYDRLRDSYEQLTEVHEELAATEEELREKYGELHIAKEEADKANKAKSLFLANMSHEIRTPLNGALGFLEILESTELTLLQREYTDIIKKSSYHLLEVIDNVLDISKIEAGKIELNLRPFDLREQMNRLVEEMSVIAKQKGIELECLIEYGIMSDVIGDDLRINQILINLLNNAIKFTDSGHVHLVITKAAQTHTHSKIQFSVEDTGIGISESFRDEMFSVFTQEDETYTRKYGGSGLGLSISKNLVNLMHGDLWYEPNDGGGSIFNFAVELELQHPGGNSKPVPSDQPGEVRKTLENTVIMVVEDNEINRMVTTSFLKNMNCNCISFENGKEAVDYFAGNAVDLIIMDIQMPVMDGIQATKLIRAMEEKTSGRGRCTIIASTAYAMAGDREKFLSVGMDDYLAKPYQYSTFFSMIDQYL